MADEFKQTHLLVSMLNQLTGKGFWLDYQQENVCHKAIAALKTFGSLPASVEHKLLILADGRALKHGAL